MLRVLDVPITDRSVMIEVLSLLSPFRRLAGYAYALRSDGITDYERSSGITLPFGKNRVNFAAATVPYFLEFFPRWGVRSGIISVYTGEPDGAPPLNGPWRLIPGFDIELRLSQGPSRIEYRRPSNPAVLYSMASGAIAGAGKRNGYLIWRTSSAYGWANLQDLTIENVDNQAAFDSQYADSESIIL